MKYQFQFLMGMGVGGICHIPIKKRIWHFGKYTFSFSCREFDLKNKTKQLVCMVCYEATSSAN